MLSLGLSWSLCCSPYCVCYHGASKAQFYAKAVVATLVDCLTLLHVE